MNKSSDDWNKLKHLVDLSAENARLKAEVERLESMADENAHLHKGIYSLSLNVVQLKAEVERLRKAGDDLVEAIKEMDVIIDMDSNHPEVDAWNAAKEGKPSEQKSPSFIEDLGNGVEKHDLLFRYPAKEGKQP